MSEGQSRALGRRALGEARDRGLALAAFLIVAVLATLMIVETGGEDVRPDRDSLVTVQQPSGWERRQGAAGLGVLPPPRDDTPGRRLGEGLRLVPRALEGEVAYAVTAETDPALLAMARFRPGDVVMALDGRPLDPARIDQLGDELSLLDAVEVSFLRDGAMRKRVIDLRH